MVRNKQVLISNCRLARVQAGRITVPTVLCFSARLAKTAEHHNEQYATCQVHLNTFLLGYIWGALYLTFKTRAAVNRASEPL